MSRYVFDIETDGLLDTLTTIHCLVLKDIDTGRVHSFHDHPADAVSVSADDGSAGATASAGCDGSIQRGLRLLGEASFIAGHNVIKFDIPAIQKVHPEWRPGGAVRDTLVLVRLIHADIKESDFVRVKRGQIPPGHAGKHDLETWGYRLGKWKGDYSVVRKAKAKALGIKDKAEVARFVWGAWNQDMQDYCVQDVEVTHALLESLNKSLSQGWSDECVELEHGVAWVIARQERYGFAFDVEKAVKLHSTMVAHRSRINDKLQAVFKPKRVTSVFVPKVNNKKMGYVKGVPFEKVKVVPFNPKSRQHMAERLQSLGWEPNEFGKDGIPSVTDDILNLLPWDEAKLMAEFAMVEKRLGALASGREAWLKHERNGRIHGGVVTNGAVTGRMTHQHPNIAQVPAATSRKTGEKQPYGHECRELFTVSKGKKLVGCDADALELRDLAGYMARYDGGDYIKVILEGRKEDKTDMHSVNARALGCARDTAKVWFYAFIYGAGDYKLGLILGVTGSVGKITRAGKSSRAKFMKNLPALGKLSEAVKEKVKKQGFLKGLDGRKLRIRKEHAALNTLLQSCGAIQMKRALLILDEGLQARGFVPGVNYEFVANVHDEWQIEVDPEIAHIVGEMAADAIRLAGEYYSFRCPLRGNYDIGTCWADTH